MVVWLQQKKATVATEVLNLLDLLINHSQKVAAHAEEKLSIVMRSSDPCVSKEETISSEVWPPLFEDIRAKVAKVDAVLTDIQKMLTRTEL